MNWSHQCVVNFIYIATHAHVYVCIYMWIYVCATFKLLAITHYSIQRNRELSSFQPSSRCPTKWLGFHLGHRLRQYIYTHTYIYAYVNTLVKIQQSNDFVKKVKNKLKFIFKYE